MTQTRRRPRIPQGLPATIAGVLRDRVRSGLYQVGNALPSERELVDELNVDRRTIRTAIEELKNDGILDRRPNCRPIVQAVAALQQSDSMSSPTGLPSSRLIALVMWHGGAVDGAGTAQQRVFWGMNEVLGASGYHGLFLDVGQSSGKNQQSVEREQEHLTYVLNCRFGGVVFYPQAYNCNRDLMREVAGQMPFVLIDRMVPGVQADFAESENRKSMADATWYLIKKGHKRIAFVTSGEFVNSVDERLNGYLEALTQAFSAEAYQLVLTPPLQQSRSWPMMDAIVKLPADERPTAIICVNNLEALRVASFLAQANIHVPDDISLIGFDNFQATLPNGVELTTVAQPFEEIGKSAAKLIIRRIQDPSSTLAHIELPTRLIEHDSVKRLIQAEIPVASVNGYHESHLRAVAVSTIHGARSSNGAR